MISLTFSPTVDINQPQVAIINDEVHENAENFSVGLLATPQNQPVNISRRKAIITILDDNDCTFAQLA